MSDQLNIPQTIEVRRMPAGYFELYIDGKKKDFIYGSTKWFMKRYLKRTYDIDLRTDTRIIKNFKEFETRKVSENNGKKLYIKKQLLPACS